MENQLIDGCMIDLNTDQSHYLRNVLRLKINDNVILFNGIDGEWLAQIDKIAKKCCSLILLEQLRPQKNTADIWLLFAPIKKTRLSLLIEKATELGITHILPTITQYSNIANMRISKMQTTAIEAVEQCERLDIPKISNPCHIDDIINSWDRARIIYVCAEFGQTTPITKMLTSHKTGIKAAFFIGPEGGFSKLELEKLAINPFVKFIGLGPRILRAETAAIAAISCWQAICGDWQEQPARRE